MFPSSRHCTVSSAFHPRILPGSCLEVMLVHITSLCQCNILWYLHHFPAFYLDIPVYAITSPCQYNILWYLPPFSVSFFPVSGLPHIFLVRIFTTFLQKILLFHISQMLIFFSSCSCYAWNQHPLYIFFGIFSHLQLNRWVSWCSHHSNTISGFP